MKKLPASFLIMAVIAIAVSFTERGSAFGWGILKPLGAILFILFFMTHMMAREIEEYDREESARRRRAGGNAGAAPEQTDSSRKESRRQPASSTTANSPGGTATMTAND